MSNNDKATATDYVKSYVGSNTTNAEDYLSQQQPRYDPSKPISQPQTTPIEETESPTKPIQASEHWKMHLPTQNPIPSASAGAEKQSATETTAKPEVVWSSREFKEQRSEIHEASLILCADLHENLMTCFKDGSWWDKAKMCEDQKQRFWSCYNTQKVKKRERE
jgi:hypothetical protein